MAKDVSAVIGRDPESATHRLGRFCRATAEIVYRMPDHPDLLQTFVWQHDDIAPDYPVLRRFLAFWQANLDGSIHSVHVTRTRLVKAPAVRVASQLKYLH